ncbi:hypothetical protein FACS1894151_08780 [Spirochaetia bacterium]|nr:hypothetical protein FACS1894151_08780 [Spirochaetia bacterium]
MIKNWKVTARLSSPLAGKPPKLDAVLEWELSKRLGYKQGFKLTRDIPLSEVKRVPIPLAQRTIGGRDIYCCSDPIMPEANAEWVEHLSKRIDTGLFVQLLAPEEWKAIGTTSGPYKMRYAPVQVRLIDRVCWFVRGDRKEISKLLKSVFAIGQYRKIGYGIIGKWEFEETEDDNSIFAERDGKKVLMKTIPAGNLEKAEGYTLSFGGAAPPYWHPENTMEIAIPC